MAEASPPSPYIVPTPPVSVGSAENLLSAVQSNPITWYEYMQRLDLFAHDASTHLDTNDRDLAEANHAILDLNNRLAGSNAIAAELREQIRSAPTAVAHSSPRSEKHPDPPMYGGDRAELRTWTTQLRLKLLMNADRYPTMPGKLAYAISRLKDTALYQIRPYIKDDDTIDLRDVSELITKLELAFGDPDRKATAQRELRRLQQANREFHVYLAEYQRLIPDTGYNEEAKRSILLEGISNELKSAILTLDLPTDLDEVIQILQKIDNRYRATQASIRKAGTVFSNTSRSSSAPTIAAVSKPTPAPAPTVTTTTKISAPPSSDAMDLSVSRHRGPLTPAEKSRRMNEGLCMYCGGSGHFAQSCPLSSSKTRPRFQVSEMEQKTLDLGGKVQSPN